MKSNRRYKRKNWLDPATNITHGICHGGGSTHLITLCGEKHSVWILIPVNDKIDCNECLAIKRMRS